MPDYVNNVPAYVTNQIGNAITVGTSNDTSDYFVGDWSNLLIGLRTDLEISRHADPLMLSNGQVVFVGWLRMDVQVARLGAFEVLAGLRA
jgi:HK97 family phage major capsid protein